MIDRRTFLKRSAAVAGVVAVPSLLTACTVPVPGAPGGTTSAPAASGKPAGGVKLPTYVPAQSAKPDYPGTAEGVDPGYVKFPETLTRTVTEAPSKGGEFTGLILTTAGTPPPVDRNGAWQQLNSRLGGTLKIIGIPQADYASKWAAVTAGGDLPDVMYVTPVPILPNIPAFAKAACADLTPYLSGDAVKDYPNLANYPTASWRIAIKNNGIAGIPIVRSLTGPVMFVQQNLVDAAGAGALKTADDFKRLCKALTNPQANRWAIGMTNDNTAGPYAMWFFQGIFRAPNNWRLDGGKLSKDIETEEYKAALGLVRELVASGYVSPDVKTNVDLNNDLYSGKVAMRANAWANYQNQYSQASVKFNISIRSIPVLAADANSKPGHILSAGSFGFSLVKNGTPDRIKELLRVLNFLAAPFGSEEYMVNRFGVKGADYTLDAKGNPALTEQGAANIPGTPGQNWGYMASAPNVSFSLDSPDFGRFGHEEQGTYIAAGISDPCVGQFSTTDEAKGAQLNLMIFDRVSAIAAGRAPLTDLDQLVKDWRSQGGDQIRTEFQQALQVA
jgi:putative aldouronate transport system substrate-binding protein